MEKTKALFCLLVAALLLSPMALAEDTTAAAEIEVTQETQVTTTPDQAGYGLKLGLEKIGLMFTFNQEKKAQKELMFAERRLAEAQVMAQRGNMEAMGKAKEQHDKFLEKAQKRLEKMNGNDKEKGIKDSFKGLVGLERAMANHEQRLENLKDVASEANLTDEQRTELNEMIADMEAKVADFKEKEDDRGEKLKVKLRAVGNLTEDEIDDALEKIRDDEGLNVTMKIVAENRIEHTEDAIEKLSERIEDEKEKGSNVSYFESQLVIAKANLEVAKSLYEAGNYTGAIQVIKPVSNFGRNLNVAVREENQERRQEKMQDMAKEMKENNLALRNEVREKIQEMHQEELGIATEVGAQLGAQGQNGNGNGQGKA